MNREQQCVCVPPRYSGERFCSECGRQPFHNGASGDNIHSNVTVHSQGVGAGGNISVGGDMVVGAAAANSVPNDVVLTPMHREQTTRALLPDNWVTAAAGLCTIAFYISNFRLELFGDGRGRVAGILMMLLAAGVLISSLYIKLGTRAGHPLLSPFAPPFTYEALSDGKIYRTRLSAECPWCATVGRLSPMHLRKLGKPPETLWVCRSYDRHRLDYDPGLVHIPDETSLRRTDE